MSRTALLTLTLLLQACGEGLDFEPSEEAAPQLPAQAYRHVIAAGSAGLFIVLHQEPAAEWGRGEPRQIVRGFPSVLERDVQVALLPSSLLSWQSKVVHAMGTRNPRCVAEVGELMLVGQLLYEFGYEDEGEDAKERASVDDDQARARELWSMAGVVLAARLRPLSGSCEGATWARIAATPAPLIAAAQPASPALRGAALSAFAKLPAYRTVEERYEEWQAEADATETRGVPWELHDSAVPEVSLLSDPGSGVSIVSVSVSTGEGCGGFYGELTALWRIDEGADQLELVGVLEADRRPAAIVDLEGEGRPVVLFEGGAIYATGAELGVIEPVQVPSYICPC
jgi:hypothetical protein